MIDDRVGEQERMAILFALELTRQRGYLTYQHPDYKKPVSFDDVIAKVKSGAQL